MPVTIQAFLLINMNLAIDIGNSFVHFCIFRGSKLIELKTASNNAVPAIKSTLDRLLKKHQPVNVGIASVNPNAEKKIAKMLPKYSSQMTLTVNFKSKLPIVIKVKNSHTLGADRICNAVYGYLKAAGKNSLVIDLGTANTYDLVLKDGSFIGGIIAPGLMTSALALNANTAKLPVVDILNSPNRTPLIGRNTKEAISSGLVNYMLFATQGIVSAVKKQYGSNIEVFLTGGSAPLIARRADFKFKSVKNTVLEGINMIINYNRI